MAARPWRTADRAPPTRPAQGARPGFDVSVWSAGEGRVLPQTPKLGKGFPRGARRPAAGVCEGARLRPPLGLGSVPPPPAPRPKMAPGRCLPSDCGGAGARGPAGGGEGAARTRARTDRPGRAAPRRGPLRPHERRARRAGAGRPSCAPRGQDPGAAASVSLGPAPGRAPEATRAAAGVSVCREGGATRGLGPTKAQEEGAGGGGGRSRLPRTSTLMKCRLGSPRRERHILGKCKRHWQMQGKQAEFLLATK